MRVDLAARQARTPVRVSEAEEAEAAVQALAVSAQRAVLAEMEMQLLRRTDPQARAQPLTRARVVVVVALAAALELLSARAVLAARAEAGS